MKRQILIALAASCLLAAALPTGVRAAENPFSDVSESDYYYDAVLWAFESDVTGGTTETTFSPADTCTRGQVMTFLWRAAGQPEPQSWENPFTDVPESAYYYKAALWAVERGITAGTTATTFSPASPCTYAQVLTFLWRGKGSPAPDGESEVAARYADAYYADALAWADKSGMLTGALLVPANPCPRADIVNYMYRGGRTPDAAPETAEAPAVGLTFADLEGVWYGKEVTGNLTLEYEYIFSGNECRKYFKSNIAFMETVYEMQGIEACSFDLLDTSQGGISFKTTDGYSISAKALSYTDVSSGIVERETMENGFSVIPVDMEAGIMEFDSFECQKTDAPKLKPLYDAAYEAAAGRSEKYAFYKDFPDVPDYGAMHGGAPITETSELNGMTTYRYSMADLKGQFSTKYAGVFKNAVFEKYVAALEDCGFKAVYKNSTATGKPVLYYDGHGWLVSFSYIAYPGRRVTPTNENSFDKDTVQIYIQPSLIT